MKAVGYEKKMHERAKADKKVLFTVSIDRRYCTHLDPNEQGSLTMQGLGDGITDERVTRLLLILAGVDPLSIDEALKGRFPR